MSDPHLLETCFQLAVHAHSYTVSGNGCDVLIHRDIILVLVSKDTELVIWLAAQGDTVSGLGIFGLIQQRTFRYIQQISLMSILIYVLCLCSKKHA